MFSFFSSSVKPPAPIQVEDLDPSPERALVQMLDEKVAVQAKDLIICLEKFYSPALVQRCLKYLPHPEGKVEKKHVLIALAAIGNSMRVEDVCPSRRDIWRLPRKLGQYRNPLQMLSPKSQKTLWDELEGNCKDKTHYAYVRYQDATQRFSEKMIRAMHTDIASPEEAAVIGAELVFAGPEHRAKMIGYAKPETVCLGMVIPVFNAEANEIFYYQLNSKINQKGLHAYLFTPINRPGAPAQLIFRGTKGIKSAGRDLDTSGVGKTAFEAQSPQILQMISDYLKQNPSNNGLEIMGHSLGGADAQRATALVVNEIRNGGLKGLDEVRLYAFASPKLDKETCAIWAKNLRDLAALQPGERVPQIELNFAEHVSDAVTWTGDFNLCGANAHFINTTHLLVESKSKGVLRTAEHHQSSIFGNDGSFDFKKGERTFILYKDQILPKEKERLAQLPEEKKEDEEDFVHISDEESALIKNIDKLESQRVKIEGSQKGLAQHSWVVWTVSQVGGQPVKGFAYYTFKAIGSLLSS